MKLVVLLLACITLVASHGNYELCSKYAKILERNLENPKAVKFDLECFIDVGPCAKYNYCYKKRTTSDIATACRECSTQLKILLRKFLTKSQELYPHEAEIFRLKYDPNNKYYPPLMAALKSV